MCCFLCLCIQIIHSTQQQTIQHSIIINHSKLKYIQRRRKQRKTHHKYFKRKIKPNNNNTNKNNNNHCSNTYTATYNTYIYTALL